MRVLPGGQKSQVCSHVEIHTDGTFCFLERLLYVDLQAVFNKNQTTSPGNVTYV